MNELALFAGAGGGLLGSKLLGWRTVCYVENDRLCQSIIKARIKDGLLDDAPIWDDVQTFNGRPWTGSVDIITAGFPCQPFSIAGQRAGPADKRNLWEDTIRIIGEVKPEWCLLENVSAILSFDYVRRIFASLAEVGFDCRWSCISAFDVGAPHLRERLWIVAHAHDRRCSITKEVKDGKRIGGGDHIGRSTWWKTEPALERVAHGLARGVGQQLKPIGNGQVPAVVREAWSRSVINAQ